MITQADLDAAAPVLRRVPKQARSRDTLRRVLEAAMELLARNDALTTTAITARAGIRPSRLYDYLADASDVRVCLDIIWQQRAHDAREDITAAAQRLRTPEQLADQLTATLVFLWSPDQAADRARKHHHRELVADALAGSLPCRQPDLPEHLWAAQCLVAARLADLAARAEIHNELAEAAHHHAALRAYVAAAIIPALAAAHDRPPLPRRDRHGQRRMPGRGAEPAEPAAVDLADLARRLSGSGPG